MIYIEIDNDKVINSTPNKNIAKNFKNVITTNFDDYTPTNDKYIYLDGVIFLNPNYEAQKLILSKEAKQQENLAKANEAITNGYVVYKNCKFETNTDNQSNMTATANLMQAQPIESTPWLSKDNIPIELTLEDFLNIGALILEFKTNLWTNVYAGFEAQIEDAQTIEEVESIEIVY